VLIELGCLAALGVTRGVMLTARGVRTVGTHRERSLGEGLAGPAIVLGLPLWAYETLAFTLPPRVHVVPDGARVPVIGTMPAKALVAFQPDSASLVIQCQPEVRDMAGHVAQLDGTAIRDFCRKWKVKRLSVFGSILRDDFRADSDVDFLADYDDDADWGIFDHLDMEEELGQIVGRKVDLLTLYAVETDPNWLFRKAVLSSAEAVYVG